MHSLILPQLNNEEAEQLGQPITLEELKEALQGAKKGKVPGLDGIPAELFLKYFDLLGPIFLAAIHEAVNTGAFHPQLNIALISLIPKKGKDHSNCANYRPISLLNTDIKMYARILALRLQRYINKLVHPDQTGFMPGRLASDNIRRLLHVIHEARDCPTPAAVLSLDAEKAFDRLEWDYLWSVLEVFGLGTNFINMIKVLYRNPTASVITNGLHSSPFNLGRGTRQGCPLSPMLFALSLEPLAQLIRQEDICSFSVKSHKQCISLYADDILLFISDLQTSFPLILNVFGKFSLFSGYKINWDKSSILPLNSIAKLSYYIKLSYNIPIRNSITYLGIAVQSSLQTIPDANYLQVLSRVEQDLRVWTSMPLSLHARIASVKMNILPQINFLSSMIPLPAPKKFWHKLNSMIRKFIWNGKQPRLKF